MTAHQYSLSDQSQKRDETAVESRLNNASGASPEQGVTLNKRLLKTLLPISLLPLALASGLGVLVTRRSEQEQALFLLQEESFLASEAASVFVNDSFKVIEGIMLNPQIAQSLRQTGDKVESSGLVEQSDADLEQQYGQTKLLETNSLLNQYFADVVQVEEMGELFVTERNGLNVAYSAPPSDFVQRDEEWWTAAVESGKFVEPVEFDESAGVFGLSIAEAVTPANSDEVLGVMKAVIPVTDMTERIATYTSKAISGGQQVQIVDSLNGVAFATVAADSIITGASEVVGGEAVVQFGRQLLGQLGRSSDGVETLKQELAAQLSGKLIELERIESAEGEELLSALLVIGKKEYSVTTVPGTAWVSVSSVDLAEINSAGNSLLLIFAVTAVVLGIATSFILRLLSDQLSAPLSTLTATAKRATGGDLDVRARPEGTVETQLLGTSFNTLLEQIQALLSRQEQLTDEQRQQRESLENDISRLMEEVGEAADGDLSVRAQLSASDVGIIADLFNAIIENLRDIAYNVKESAGDVNQSLLTNEQEIRALAEQAIEEAESMKATMLAVQEMGQSIEAVADNASQASVLTDETYMMAQTGTESMEQTADSILELRSTVGETAKKIKRLGESAQKIAQAVSLIDEIALKTNLLAVNASVEASRAGELGQGFTAVAEQVGALAEQSAGATKTIAQIVTEIQTETQEVVDAIETGTAQVVDSSKLVTSTRQQLQQVLDKSKEINHLMQSISVSTVNQAKVSTAVTELIQKASRDSEERSQASVQVAQAIQSTAQVAQELQASVEQFKGVEKSTEE